MVDGQGDSQCFFSVTLLVFYCFVHRLEWLDLKVALDPNPFCGNRNRDESDFRKVGISIVPDRSVSTSSMNYRKGS